ncbi:MAG: Protein translocase subunit SecA [Chlamydiae bacterium]|nr:Protein translocase subunit SecA [Chlamydiota bacterium]
MFSFFKKIFGTQQDRAIRKYRSVVTNINQLEENFQSLSDEQIRAKTDEFKKRLEVGETLDQILPEAYAVVKNVCRRLLGSEVHVSGYDQKWDMVPYDVQLIGAIAMHDGTIAEMQTGEGKTVTATLPLYLNALTGRPVHLVTVNDYLAERDCQWTGSILRWLGLKTGVLTNATPMENRKDIYECDVVYGTASEFGFDYLRDNSMAMSKDQQVQRGYFFAIIDEVDSILIDEARTPLIISGPAPESYQMYGDLKSGVSELVRRQRDFCNRLATEAKRVLDKRELEGSLRPSDEEIEGALRKLWVVSKGTPRHKIVKRMQEDPDLRTGIDNIDLYYHGEQGKKEKAGALAELVIIVDEKSSEYELTDKGIHSWSEIAGSGHDDDFVMMDISHEFIKVDDDASLSEEEKMQKKLDFQDEDAKRKERAHNVRQMLRAHLLMEKDVDYIIQDSKIVIIDENTGRPQPGRRFSDGLHQSIEAKEGVPIQRETQTYATITLQNFFRMYDKISGMTGTAVTEAGEFKEIYKLDVLSIPTHKPCIRTDANDEIYMTEREKYNAILKDVVDENQKGRPILIGTESVEVSEKLSRIFRQNGLNHVVLNAKNHEREAEIVANAGQNKTITIATNMAGRGTDIKLGVGVADIGGLYVLGTTRHQSRRTDRQLRGRSARQGDRGSTKFYVSFEDSLMRLFASPKLNAILQRFRPPEGEPISAKILNRSIETAQKRVEQRNYTIRKHTLEYDDVMNKQRQEIYAFRNLILHAPNVIEIATEVLEDVCYQTAEDFYMNRMPDGGWDIEGFRQWLLNYFPIALENHDLGDENADFESSTQFASEKVMSAFREKVGREMDKVKPAEGSIPTGQDNPVEYAVRNLMTQEVDKLWQRHLLSMDHLRSDVMLRQFGQRDPLMEFKREAFELFHELSINLRTIIAQNLFKFELMPVNTSQLEAILGQMRMESERSLVEGLDQPMGAKPPPAQEEPEKSAPVYVARTPGRNDMCPCGSGKKYKKCCGQKEEVESA